MSRDIKKEILAALLKAEKLRYSDIQPDGVDSDLFNYHLQHLVKLGLVDKENKEYSLSALGRHEVAEQNPLSLQGKTVDRFKLNVLTVVLRREKERLQVLMQRRKKHPFFNTIAIMGGVIHKGELLTEAASARLQMKTGLTADFRLSGLWRNINYDASGVLILEDILFHICCADQYQGELLPTTDHGENFWLDIDEAVIVHQNHPGSFKRLVPFLTELKAKDFRQITLFYWEQKQNLQNF